MVSQPPEKKDPGEKEIKKIKKKEIHKNHQNT
jgi:hypothetical protein